MKQTDFPLFCCCFLRVCLSLPCLSCAHCVHLILQDVLQEVGTGHCWKHIIQVCVCHDDSWISRGSACEL